MLVVRLEIWPGGSPKHKRVLGTIAIANDGTGDVNTGNYQYQVFGKKRPLSHGTGEVKDYKRKRHTPWKLIWEVLDKMFKEREGAKQADP